MLHDSAKGYQKVAEDFLWIIHVGSLEMGRGNGLDVEICNLV
jgi:hypothetical protein